MQWWKMQWAQENPWHECPTCGPHNKCCCRDQRRSFSTRQAWAKRESSVLINTLIKARRDGYFLTFANANFPKGITPQAVKDTTSAFTKLARTIDDDFKIRGYLELDSSGKPHTHFFILSRCRIDHQEIQRRWQKALGDWYKPNVIKVYTEGIESIVGASKYVTGDCKEKYRAPMFRRNAELGTSLQLTWGTRGKNNFFGQGETVKLIYKRLCRYWAAMALARADGFIMEHPTFDYYLALADAMYDKEKSELPPEYDPYVLESYVAAAAAWEETPTPPTQLYYYEEKNIPEETPGEIPSTFPGISRDTVPTLCDTDSQDVSWLGHSPFNPLSHPPTSTDGGEPAVYSACGGISLLTGYPLVDSSP